jgi:hypothetical protein
MGRGDQSREDHELKSRLWITRELLAEVDRQRESAGTRTAAMITRLSILMAAASIAGGAALTQKDPGIALIAAALLAAAAAVTGAVALLPRGVGENGIEEMQREMWNVEEPRALHVLLARKTETLRDEERLLDFRASCARVGFLLLTFSLVAIAAGVVEKAM